MEKNNELNGTRRLAFLGVTVASIATLVCVICVPMIYTYLQRTQIVMQNEVDFCKVQSRYMWKEVSCTQVTVLRNLKHTVKNQEFYK